MPGPVSATTIRMAGPVPSRVTHSVETTTSPPADETLSAALPTRFSRTRRSISRSAAAGGIRSASRVRTVAPAAEARTTSDTIAFTSQSSGVAVGESRA